MGLFNKIPSRKKIDETNAKIRNLSANFLKIIKENDPVHYKKVDIDSLSYATFLYDTYFYSQVMQVKYSPFFVESTIRTIFISLEQHLRNAGNSIEKDFIINMYKNLSDTFNKLYNIAKENNLDEFDVVARYFCEDVLLMNEVEINGAYDLIEAISNHFNQIINLPENQI